MAPRPRLDAIGLVAADLAASISFYRRVGVPFPEPQEGETHLEAPMGDGVRLMIDTEQLIRELFPDWQGGTGRVSFAVRLDTPAEVDELYAELAADGFGETEPWDAFWGQRYATVRDPDGQQVDLYAALPPATDGGPGPG